MKKAKIESASALDALFEGKLGVLGDIEYRVLRDQVLTSGLRVDGRKPTEVRQISIDTGLLPRAHGSALFTRGQTQVMSLLTLGTAKEGQRIDDLPPLREVIARHDLKAKKSLGQNFLFDLNLTARIARTASGPRWSSR